MSTIIYNITIII